MSSYEEAYAYLERHVDALKTNRTGDERQTDAEVFDRKTLLTIYDMMTSGYIDQVHYPISTGKEGNVFYATDEDGEGMALKIFRTSTSTFKIPSFSPRLMARIWWPWSRERGWEKS